MRSTLPECVRARRTASPTAGSIGVGFACYSEQTGHGCGEWVSRGSPFIPGYESCTAQLLPDGTLVLLVGIQSHGQGLETTLSQIAHEELGIDPARISVRHGDTGACPFGMGTIASRSIVMAGGAVAHTSRLLRDKILRIGAHLLQCDPADVHCAGGQVVGKSGAVGIDEVARVAHLRMEALPQGVEPLLSVTATYQPGIDTGVYSYATHAAVVAVDPATGMIELLDFAVAEDCGTMINPMIVEGQVRGGVVQGIGTALYEEIPYDAQGQPLVGTLADYLVPGAAELPAIKIVHLHTPTPYTEYGVKGMGEGGAIAPPAAIANAVRDALASLGAEVNETPLTPRRVLAAIRKAQAATKAGAKRRVTRNLPACRGLVTHKFAGSAQLQPAGGAKARGQTRTMRPLPPPHPPRQRRGGRPSCGGSEKRERADLDALARPRVGRRGRIVEGGVGRPAGAAVLRRVVDLEHQRLVAPHRGSQYQRCSGL